MSQHDFTIANQGFPAFRSDLNNALQALASLSSGSSAPSPTFAYQIWIDTSAAPAVLKLRNGDNDAWISLGNINNSLDTFQFILSGGLSGSLALTGNARTTPVAVTFNATTMTVDCSLSNIFTTTFTANVTTAPTISNPGDGQTINWFITQDATGGRTMTWPTSFKFASGSPVTLSTQANAVDLVVATYRASVTSWYVTLARNFA